MADESTRHYGGYSGGGREFLTKLRRELRTNDAGFGLDSVSSVLYGVKLGNEAISALTTLDFST